MPKAIKKCTYNKMDPSVCGHANHGEEKVDFDVDQFNVTFRCLDCGKMIREIYPYKETEIIEEK